MPWPRPDPSTDERAGLRAGERWVTLEQAATALHLTQQALWHRLQELRVEVRRIEVGGRQVSGLSSADLARLGAPINGERSASPTVIEPKTSPARFANTQQAEEAREEQPSLWAQLREFETQRNQLGFELHIVRTQLADARARAQQVEDSLRAMREEFERARADVQTARMETECARAQYAGLAAERAAAQSARDAAQQQLAAMEREMNKLLEIERARERYCDRLEQRMRTLGAA